MKTVSGMIPLILLTIMLAACSGGGGSSAPATGQIDLSTSFDVDISKLPSNGSLKAYASTDGGTPKAMTVVNNTASVSLADLVPGHYDVDVRIVFEYDGGASVTLATASVDIDLVEGTNSLNIGIADYVSGYDDDNDGLTNLQEINSGTSPLGTGCVLGFSLLGSCTLGS